MGLTKVNNLRSFTREDVLSRDLVINMLRYEHTLGCSAKGQLMYKNKLNEPMVSLTVEKALNRMVLTQFWFDTSGSSLANYRSIFKTYFNNPDNNSSDTGADANQSADWPTTGAGAWRGPYVESYDISDPWGNAYVINSQYFQGRYTGTVRHTCFW